MAAAGLQFWQVWLLLSQRLMRSKEALLCCCLCWKALKEKMDWQKALFQRPTCVFIY